MNGSSLARKESPNVGKFRLCKAAQKGHLASVQTVILRGTTAEIYAWRHQLNLHRGLNCGKI